MTSEQQLIDLARNGDNSARRELYTRYSGSVMALSMRYVADRDAACDVLQDCFIKVFTSLGGFSYRGEGSFKAWVLRIAVNLSLEYLRHNARMDMSAAIPDMPDDDSAPDIARVPMDEIMGMIARLPASDRPPVDLQGMKDRLLTRFKCGLTAELEKPNTQLCMDILNTKCRRDGLKIPSDVIQFIAETANGSVRDLEGVINSLMAYSVVYNCNIDMRLAERVIKRAVKIDNHPLTVDDILEKVCNHYNVTQQNVFSRSRKRDYVIVRQVSMYFAQKYTKMPASRIGQLIGNRDHSTVIHSCSAVEKRLKVDKAFGEELGSIENSFKLKK